MKKNIENIIKIVTVILCMFLITMSFSFFATATESDKQIRNITDKFRENNKQYQPSESCDFRVPLQSLLKNYIPDEKQKSFLKQYLIEKPLTQTNAKRNCMNQRNRFEDGRYSPSNVLDRIFSDLDLYPSMVEKSQIDHPLEPLVLNVDETNEWPIYTGNPNYLYAMTPNGTEKWSFLVDGGTRSSPAIGKDGTIYVGSIGSRFYAVAPEGTTKWSYPTMENELFTSPAIDRDGTIYVGSCSGKIYAFGRNISDQSRSSIGSVEALCSPWPMFHQNTRNTGLSPFDTSQVDGTVKWCYPTNYSDLYSSPAISSEGTIYFGGGDYYGHSNLHALNKNGTLKWICPFPGIRVIGSSPAIGHDGVIYIGTGGVELDEGELYAVNPNGSIKWNVSTGRIGLSSPTVGTDRTVYVGGKDHRLYAVSSNGRIKWTYNADAAIDTSPAIGLDGTIYFGSNYPYGTLYAVHQNGTLKWSFTTNCNIISSPVVGDDGSIYFGTVSGIIYAMTSNGTVKWTHPTQGQIVSSPAIGSDGTIYIGTYHYWYNSYPGHAVYADIDKDYLGKEVIVCVACYTMNSCWTYIYARHEDGTPVLGWDPYLEITDIVSPESAPSVVDIDLDEDLEIVVVADDKVYVFEHDGSYKPGWPRGLSYEGTYSLPVVTDLNGDGYPEILVTSGGGSLYIFNQDGSSYKPGVWPKFVGSSESPSVGNLDGDPQLEIVIGGVDNTLLALNDDGSLLNAHWPVSIETEYIPYTPVLGDVDSDGKLEIIIGAGNRYGCHNWGLLYIYKSNGRLLDNWPQPVGQKPYYISLADIDKSYPGLEIITAPDGSKEIYAFHFDGTRVPGWPVNTGGGRLGTSPAVCDIDGDTKLEVLVSQGDYFYETSYLHIIRSDGTRFCSPINIVTPGKSPAVGDIDDDGIIEIIQPGGGPWNCGNLYLFEFTDYTGGLCPWPMIGANIAHTGLYPQTTVYVDDDNTEGPWDGTLTYPYQHIQDSIDNATDGYTVFVFNGTYCEKVTVNKSVYLIGEDKDSTVIDGSRNNVAVYISAKGVTTTGFTIQQSDIGVYSTSDYNLIHGNTITGNKDGIYLHESSYNKIYNNNITDNYYGVCVSSQSSNNTFCHNNFVNNTRSAVDKSKGSNQWNVRYLEGGGNHWDDYSGDDKMSGSDQNISGSDGIGDLPYIVPRGSQDRYPLMNPWNGTIPPILIPDMVYIDDDYDETTPGWGYTHFCRIQDGISAVCNNGRVFVYNGVYLENILIDKTIELIGEDKNSTIIDGKFSSNVVDIFADDVVICGFTIQNSGNQFFEAVLFVWSENNDISRNIITNTKMYDPYNPQRNGIYLYYSSRNTIVGNNISNCSSRNIYLKNSSDNHLSDNTIFPSNFGIYLIGSFNTDVDNNTIIGPGYNGIHLEYLSNNNSIFENTIEMVGVGIEIWESYYNTVFSNCISNGGGCIESAWSSYNILFDNNMTNNSFGISLHESFNHIVTGNSLLDNNFGFSLYGSLENDIFRNNIAKNGYGLWIERSYVNDIFENNITDSDFFGVYIESLPGYDDDYNNSFYHNNFINNTENAYDESNNTWYNIELEEGNYWSDYTDKYPDAEDADGDGIWDTPYDIPGRYNQDMFPFVNPDGWMKHPQLEIMEGPVKPKDIKPVPPP